MPAGYPAPKTLVLDLKGTLVSAEYVFGKGFEIMKRPGLSEFLTKMSQLYEIVVFSDEDLQFTFQLTESLDPRHRIFSARLGRESQCYRKGEFVKDLSYLNRDLRNVIIIDKDTRRVSHQPDNAILLREFTGASEDRELIDLVPFLEHIATKRIPDIRIELEKYGHTETSQRFINDLTKLRDSIVKKQQTGVFKLFQKPKDNESLTPLDGTTPKPPSNKAA